jgi:glutamyl-Q tRNA(Asp) synthetase
MSAPANGYRGRFAPSPTGPLHFGSLVAAMASYLDARASGGEWLVRMEDVDETRAVPGAADDILRTLETFGFQWDDSVLVQSTRKDAYLAAVESLKRSGLAYDCGCTRREIAAAARRYGAEGPIYPGTCRKGLRPGKQRPPEGTGSRHRLRGPHRRPCQPQPGAGTGRLRHPACRWLYRLSTGGRAG